MQDTPCIDIGTAVEWNTDRRIVNRARRRNLVSSSVRLNGDTRIIAGDGAGQLEARLDGAAHRHGARCRVKLSARNAHGDRGHVGAGIGREQDAIGKRVNTDKLRMMQVIFISHVGRIIKRRLNAVPIIAAIDKILAGKGCIDIGDAKRRNFDNAVLDIRPIELENGCQRLYIEISKRRFLRTHPKDKGFGSLEHRNINMVVKHRREFHLRCIGANRGKQLLTRILIGRRCRKLMTEKPAHALICFSEHGDHKLHFIVVVG